MKKMGKRIIAAAVAAALLTGCAQEKSESEIKKVSVVQIVSHKSLDTIRDSFADEMKKLGYDENNIELEYKDAGNDTSTLESILSTCAGDGSNVIVAIATPTAQSAARYAEDIPIVFAAVSDPIGAGLTSSLESPDKNITGTMDDVQVDQILETALTIDPDMKKLGVIYNGSEANSVTNIEKAKEFCEENGIQLQEVTVTSSNDVQQAVHTLAASCDAIFAPNDNTVASAMSAAAQAAIEEKIPFYVGADSMVSDGGFLTVGIDYEELGRETARMVDKVLKGTDVSSIPVKQFKTDLSTYVNQETLKALGIELPASVSERERFVMVGQE